MTPAFLAPAVAASLALEELARLNALGHLPTPEALFGRLEARTSDFNLLVGVTSAYLKAQGFER
jgi:hypothetical protein